MRPASASASYLSQLLVAALLATIACSDSTTPRTPTKLVFTVQPTTTTAGSPILPAISVAVQDEAGQTVTTATNSVTLSTGSTTPGMTLAGTVTVAAVNGVATFPNLSINVASNYTISATSPDLASATSVQFAVLTGPAAKLGFTIQPVTTLAHAVFPDLAVAVQDIAGNTVTAGSYSVSLRIGTNPGGGNLFGNPAATTLNGVATFGGISIDKTGDGYTLTAAVNGLSPAVSTPFNVIIGPASKLTFTTQPAASPPGATISPAVTVAVQDIAGNVVPTATNSITLAIGTNTGGGTLSGTTTVAAVSGVATFSDLKINDPGGYTLTASTSGLNVVVSTPFSIRNPLVFTSVSAGYFHTCGLATGGAAYCWGQNEDGPGGVPSFPTSTAPVPVSGGFAFTNLGAGRSHSCGVRTGGVAYCWGAHDNGRLGGAVESGQPVLVSGGLTFAAATAGYVHSCGVTTGGAGYCWGENSQGTLGNGTQTQSSGPAAVSGGLTFATISPGRYFTCGLTVAGVGYCWGTNTEFELGDGTNLRRITPVPVSGQLTFAMISAGGFHACGLTVDGRAYCWGQNTFGQLGSPIGGVGSEPVAVSGGLTFAMISSGNRHNCGVTPAGVAYCWGDNTYGMLGNGTTSPSFMPVPVSGGLTFASVSAGRFHTCGVTTAGAAYCWGDNNAGLLGDGTTVSRLVPVPVR